MAIKSLSIRIDETMLHKLHVVADYEGRSANNEILILIRDAIKPTKKNTAKSSFDLHNAASAAMPRPQAVCRHSTVTRASR